METNRIYSLSYLSFCLLTCLLLFGSEPATFRCPQASELIRQGAITPTDSVPLAGVDSDDASELLPKSTAVLKKNLVVPQPQSDTPTPSLHVSSSLLHFHLSRPPPAILFC